MPGEGRRVLAASLSRLARWRSAPAVPSLADAARQQGWRMTKANLGLLAVLDERLRRHEQPVVAVLVGSAPSRLQQVVSASVPTARLEEYPVALGESRLHLSLAAHGPFDLIVDDTRHLQGRVELFRSVFFHLRPGGAYLVRNFRAGSRGRRADPAEPGLPAFVARLVELQGRRRPPGRREADVDEYAVAMGVRRTVIDRQHLLFTRQGSALAKIREEEMDPLLGLRGGRSGRLLERRPPVELTPRATIRESAPSRREAPASYSVPAMALREYHDAVCLPGQVVVQGNLLLPDTYRHNQRARLTNKFTEELGPRFARPIEDAAGCGQLAGAYFYLDSEQRGHFGHAMTEQLSRLWAWPAAKRAEPGLKAVMALNRGIELRRFEEELFGAAGIPPSDITFVRSPVRVERLLAATPMLSMPEYVHPDIGQTWAAVGRRLASRAAAPDYPPRIFCSRRIEKRGCHNTAEVETLFRARGFQVLYPEDFTLPEQVMLFRRAEVIAGFAGSGLFTLCLTETPKHVVMISSESYTARNESMIADVLGHHLDVVWCRPDVAHPEGGWRRRAFVSRFTFDRDREGVFLDEILASL